MGAAAAAATTLLLAGLLYVSPALPLALVTAAVVILIAAFRPKAFALISIIAILLATPLQTAIGPLGGFADEGVIILAVVALSARRLVTEGRLIWLPGAGWFTGYLAIGLVSAVLADVPAHTAVPAALIALKGVIFAFALAQLRWTRHDLVVLVRLGIAAIVTTAVTGVLNIALSHSWALLTTGRPPLNRVGPFPAINGIFQHPAAFSRFTGVLAVACLVYGLVVRRSLANTVLVAVTAGLAFLTFQVKSIVGLLATLAAASIRFARPAAIAAFICGAPLTALIAAPPLIDLVSGDFQLYVVQDSARSQLTEGGVTVAAQHFPFGAGFGVYGSSTAADQYSPLYYELGFADRYGLGPDSGQFLNDTQWPAIYGEAGWLGAIFFAAGLGCMLLSLLRRTAFDEVPLVRWIRITGVSWMILLLVESTAAPVFVSSPSFPFVFAAAGIVASFRSAARESSAPSVGEGTQQTGLAGPPAVEHR
jgi:hypothetical protein